MSAPDVVGGVEVPPWVWEAGRTQLGASVLPDPIFAMCVHAYPERPDIDPAETPYTKAEVDERIDYWRQLLARTIDDHARGSA